jgi:hypothetical protein
LTIEASDSDFEELFLPELARGDELSSGKGWDGRLFLVLGIPYFRGCGLDITNQQQKIKTVFTWGVSKGWNSR